MSILGAKWQLSLIGANFNSTADQAIPIPLSIKRWFLDFGDPIIIVNSSVTPAGAVGGFYTAAAKGGTAVVAASQTYTANAAADDVFRPTISAAGLAKRFNAINTIYFSLTTPKGSAVTCDIFIHIVDITS